MTAQVARPLVSVDGPASLHVRLNEFLVVNITGALDESGDADPWLELRNRKSEPVDAGGLYLTTDANDPKRWQIPQGTLMPGLGFIVIWLDGEKGEGPQHTNFIPDVEGGSLYLFAEDGKTLVDSFAYEAQLADVSVGRMNDDSFWVAFLDPSPGQSNLVEACLNRRYAALSADQQVLDFQLLTPAKLGKQASFQLTNAIDGAPALLYTAITPAYTVLPGSASVLLVQLQFPTFLFMTDPLGQLSFDVNIPANPSYDGLTVYMQMLQPFGGYPGSNAVAYMLCDDG